MTTSTERARTFKQRLYEAGYKQKIVWVKRDGGKTSKSKIDRTAFIRKLDELTADMPKRKLSKLYAGIIKFIETN